MAKIIAVCISEKKGTQKHEVPEILLKVDHGIVGDAHAGNSLFLFQLKQLIIPAYSTIPACRGPARAVSSAYPIRDTAAS